jgi:hypothetical protein
VVPSHGYIEPEASLARSFLILRATGVQSQWQ